MTIALEPITLTNTPIYKNIRLRALLDSPTAFSSTDAETAGLSDDDWLKRAAHWSSNGAIAYLAMDAGDAVGMAAGVLDLTDPSAPPHVDVGGAESSPFGDRPPIGRRGRGMGSRSECAKLVLVGYQQQRSGHPVLSKSRLPLTGRSEAYPNDPALFNLEMLRRLT